ncbi:MAG: UTP--glucose-1-phosphate uridylyltransferase [Myxococcales bacterium]|nr:UTP--glucose-1-phosphate uridylyltransferase [Polyangiaceae bacterium]MDW8248989.1 UTP--glucose-1-phosphate uridylyltransferase [Myxococcales bacterium]
MSSLQQEIEALPQEIQWRLTRGSFDVTQFLRWAEEQRQGIDRDATNRLAAVSPPAPEDVVEIPAVGTEEHRRHTELGQQALNRGEVALLVLAGGMATRMGSVVKALVEALPGKTFLDLRLAEKDALSRRYGRPFPLWLMTSEATDGPIRQALGARLEDPTLAVFQQHVSLRLRPDGSLFRTSSGEVDLYPTGHGDVPDALRESGMLTRFREQGGRYLWIANLDNLGATVDATLLGGHIARGDTLSVEVVPKAGDKGGIPVRYQDRPIICEEFRLPLSFDAATVQSFNTNTFLCNADALDGYDHPWTYCVVEKNVAGQPIIQRERLVGELTFHLPTRFLLVPREGEASRFLPVKDPAELERRRPAIEAVARSRGLLALRGASLLPVPRDCSRHLGHTVVAYLWAGSGPLRCAHTRQKPYLHRRRRRSGRQPRGSCPATGPRATCSVGWWL